MIRLGVVNPDTWDFLNDLYAFLSQRYITTVFKPKTSRFPIFRQRIDRHLLGRDLDRLFRRSDVVFFEWASDLLALATSRPKMGPIVTRLHRWELYAWAHLVNWNLVDYVILVSEAKRREFLKLFPALAAKTRVIPACISLNRFAYSEKEFSGAIGTLCHLMPRKRLYDLILLFSELSEQRSVSPTPHCRGSSAGLSRLLQFAPISREPAFIAGESHVPRLCRKALAVVSRD